MWATSPFYRRGKPRHGEAELGATCPSCPSGCGPIALTGSRALWVSPWSLSEGVSRPPQDRYCSLFSVLFLTALLRRNLHAMKSAHWKVQRTATLEGTPRSNFPVAPWEPPCPFPQPGSNPRGWLQGPPPPVRGWELSLLNSFDLGSEIIPSSDSRGHFAGPPQHRSPQGGQHLLAGPLAPALAPFLSAAPAAGLPGTLSGDWLG